jgi:hypothetical protein
MQRRNFLQTIPLAGIGLSLSSFAKNDGDSKEIVETDDRSYWINLLTKIVEPVLMNAANGTLKKSMPIEKAPGYSLKAEKVTHLEAIGRTLAGIAPWLALPIDETHEGKLRKKFNEYSLNAIKNIVDPQSPDYLNFREEGQPLVDGAFLAQGFLRAPKQLWEPLDVTTKKKVVEELMRLRRVKPPYNNWLLFAATIEVFLYFIGEQWDPLRVDIAIRKHLEWYKGDGWYGDGSNFHFDYYSSFVIHSMMVDIVEKYVDAGYMKPADHEMAIKRMQRYAIQLERIISPEGTFPPIGRSATYRVAAFQSLAHTVLLNKLPEELKPGQVRAALTTVMKKMFEAPGTFDADGWLQLGFCGHQPGMADTYTSTGSLYLCTTGFLALGLPADHAFWKDPAADWTAKKAWSGQAFRKDGYVDY